MPPIVLASGSLIRRDLLARAGVEVLVDPVRVDEEAVRRGMQDEGASAREIADALAEAKARRGSARHPDAFVIGCDQVLVFDSDILSKPDSPEQAREQLGAMSGNRHILLSAVVIYWNDAPQWRHIGTVRMHMRNASPAYLDDYVARNWASIRHCVGAYKLEEEGPRLFTKVEGDFFCVLGLPLLEVLAYLTERELLPG